MIKQIIDKIVAVNKLPAKVTATTDRREAITGAQYIMSCVRVGGLEAFATDISIPLKYGVDQCVGDTICAGGILYGQRNIPVILDFCKDIREVAAAGRAVPQLRQPDGDEHLGGARYMAASTRSASAMACSTAPSRSRRCSALTDSELDYVCSGINHQTWYIDIRANGRKIEKDELIAAFERHPVYSTAGKGPHRRSEALRRLFDREQRPSVANTCPGTASGRTRSATGST